MTSPPARTTSKLLDHADCRSTVRCGGGFACFGDLCRLPSSPGESALRIAFRYTDDGVDDALTEDVPVRDDRDRIVRHSWPACSAADTAHVRC